MAHKAHKQADPLGACENISELVIEGEITLRSGNIKPVEYSALFLETVVLVKGVNLADKAFVTAISRNGGKICFAAVGNLKVEEVLSAFLFAEADAVGEKLNLRQV